VIEREFQDAEGAEAIRFSHGDFGFVVQPFHHAAGKLFSGLEIVRRISPIFGPLECFSKHVVFSGLKKSQEKMGSGRSVPASTNS
jgi:hypothetical protein